MSKSSQQEPPAPLEDSKPMDRLTITNLETLRLLTEPLRMKILELMAKPATVKAVAKALQVPATKLYYHVGQLEEHGLVRVVGTRVVSGIIEKQYQVVARYFAVDRKLLEIHKTDRSSLTEVLSNLIESVSEDIQRGLENGLIKVGNEYPAHQRLILGRNLIKLTPEQAEEFVGKVSALLESFDTETDSSTSRSYSLFMAFHPHSLAKLEEDGDE